MVASSLMASWWANSPATCSFPELVFFRPLCIILDCHHHLATMQDVNNNLKTYKDLVYELGIMWRYINILCDALLHV